MAAATSTVAASNSLRTPAAAAGAGPRDVDTDSKQHVQSGTDRESPANEVAHLSKRSGHSSPGPGAGHEAAPRPSGVPSSKDDGEAADRARAKREAAAASQLRSEQEGLVNYIVGLKEGATEVHAEAVRGHAAAAARRHHGAAHGERVRFHRHYSHALRGFAARLSPEVKADLERHEHVKYVLPDGVVVPAEQQYAIVTETLFPTLDFSVTKLWRDTGMTGTGPETVLSKPRYNGTAPSASLAWHLDRLDQVTGGMTLDGRYDRGTAAGTGVDVYVIDTGVRDDHPQLTGRTVRLYDVDSDMYASSSPYWGLECSLTWHGTATASIAAGSTLGAAPNASVFGLKVFARKDRSNPASSCAATTTDSRVIAGIDAAIANIRQRGRKSVVLIAVASISNTTNAANPAYTDAFSRLRATDIDALPVTAAGNSYADACNASPGNSPGALNVGASDQDDYRAGFSNWGSCVDIFAPGQSIRAAGAFDADYVMIYNNNKYDKDYMAFGTPDNQRFTNLVTVHGTSYAAALVAGTAALYRETHPNATASAVETAILQASLSQIDGAGLKGAPNRLLNTRALNLPGAANVAGAPLYKATLFNGPTALCSASAKSLAGLPRDMHRSRLYAKLKEFDPPYSGPIVFVEVDTAPASSSGVFFTRIRVEEPRRSLSNIVELVNGTDPNLQVYVYVGNPALPSYQRADTYTIGTPPGSIYATPINLPFDLNDGKGRSYILPGTYYVLIQGAYYASDALAANFVLRVNDSGCGLDWQQTPTPSPSPSTSPYLNPAPALPYAYRGCFAFDPSAVAPVMQAVSPPSYGFDACAAEAARLGFRFFGVSSSSCLVAGSLDAASRLGPVVQGPGTGCSSACPYGSAQGAFCGAYGAVAVYDWRVAEAADPCSDCSRATSGSVRMCLKSAPAGAPGSSFAQL